MAIAIAFDNGNAALTVSSTELSLVSGTSTLQANTTAGVYQLELDASNMTKGDRFRVKIKHKGRAGGTQRILQQFDLYNAQSELSRPPQFILMNGWDMTIQKIAGTDRAFDYTIFRAG